MPLSIRIISSPDGESVAQWNQAFPEEGGSIGRAFGSTLQLSDASREVSGTHGVICKTSRGYQIADKSTNGLFINGADIPLGSGNQSTLSDGDVLDLGRYRLLVSCFVPEKAKAPTKMQNMGDSPFGDDPFSREPSYAATTEPQLEVEEPSFTISTLDVVDDDPFLNMDFTQEDKQPSFNLDFESDDDPLGDNEYQSNFPTNDLSTQARTSAQFSVAEYQNLEQKFEAKVDKALEMALNRLLAEISPSAMEEMFDDLAGRGFWGRKPKYWEMYQRYFNRQVGNRDCQLKFQAYFREAMRLQRSLDRSQ